MRKRITVILAAAVASVALLVPAGSAQAANLASSNWCGNGSSGYGYIVEPGKICTFWPLATRYVSTGWRVLGGGSGSVCVAIIRAPWSQGQPAQPLDDWGQPTNWSCGPLRNNGAPWGVKSRPRVTGGFGAVYGQAAVLNFSTARIQIILDQLNRVEYYY